MGEHSCYFKYQDIPCGRPVAHTLCWSQTIDGIVVQLKTYWMCEQCFNDWLAYARGAGEELKGL